MNLAIHGLKGYPEAQMAAMTAKIPQSLVLKRVMARIEAMLKDLKKEADTMNNTLEPDNKTKAVDIVREANAKIAVPDRNGKSITAEDIASAILSVTATANRMDASQLEAFSEPITQLLKQSRERSEST